MADSASDRTEEPTAQRLRKARQEGQVPQSEELPSAMILGAMMIVCWFMATELWGWFTMQVQEGLSLRLIQSTNLDGFIHIFRDKAGQTIWALAPFFAAASAASILGSCLVSGFSFAPKGIKWNMAALLPSTGMGQLFSLRSFAHLGTSLVKLALLSLIAWNFLRDKLGDVLALESATPVAALGVSFDLVFGLVARITIALVILAVADAAFQKWQYKRQLRMTRDEVREERRSLEGSPMVKGRMRAIHIAMVRRRMLRDVPKSDVVIVNPTHVAVALKYDPSTMDAPLVMAKGADKLCEKIKEIARKHAIPIIERPEIARSLYGSVEVGQIIPETLYIAVAQILAMIQRLRRQG
jgi:flagellar biosynthesis protein FlhB